MAYTLPNNNSNQLTIDKSFYNTNLDTAKVRSALGLGTNQELKLGTTTPTNIAGVSNTIPNAIVDKPVVSPSPLTAKTLASTNTGYTDNTKAPTINTNTSDIQTQAASIEAKIKDLQTQLDASVKSGEVAKGGTSETPATPNAPSIWDKLLGKVDETKNAITQSNADMTSQISNIYSQWGLTPKNFNKLKDLSVQIGDVGKQIADLDTREQQALENVTNVPGQDLAYMSGEQARISRAYAIQRSGLAAKASAMASTASALQGDWDTAYKMASQYVDNATAVQKNKVDTVKWGVEQYSDIIQAMSKEEQANLKETLDYETSLLKQQQDDYWKQMNYNLDAYKAQQGYADTPLNQLRELQIQQMTQTTPGQVVDANTGNAVKMTDAQITDLQRYDQYLNDLVPLATTLLDPTSPEKVSTGGIVGRYMKTVQGLPLVQRTLNENQNKLLTTIATMNNQLIYMLSGKQINESEYQRLKEQLPDVNLTNQQNMTRLNLFNKLMKQAKDKKLQLQGLKIAGSGTSNTTGGTDNDPLKIR